MRVRTLFFALSVCLCNALAGRAAVVVARSDEAMIRTASAVLTGTVVDLYVRHDDRGDNQTVARILVDESMKGEIAAGEIVDVVQFGGYLDGRFQAQSGAPKYESGARYLAFLERNARGEWTTFDLALGQFRFVAHDGKQSLLRDTHDIAGWTEAGEPFHDSERPAAEFLAFVRGVVNANLGPRLAPNALRPAPLALDFDLKAASQMAVTAWHGGASAMGDSVSATPASGDTKNLGDCESRVIADDPHGDISGTFNGSGVVATAFFGCGSPCGTCATSLFNSESYTAIEQADIVVNDGVSSSTLSSGNFVSAIVHEFGHTWGFRHSNQNASSAACASPLPCSSSAIMNSLIVNGLNGALQGWDLDAANEVYGDGTRQASFTGTQYVVTLGSPARRPSNMSWRISQGSVCTAPAISQQPTGSSVSSGGSASLTVVATGTATLTYQWYIGTSGNTSQPVSTGGTTATLNLTSVTSTTTYWVQVSNGCGTVNSSAATITVTGGGCTAPSITTQPFGTSVNLGSQASLTVGASGTATLSYQWYIGNPPSQAQPVSPNGTSSTLNVTPTQTTTYWVQVTNGCGFANSSPATVMVNSGCVAPVITTQPGDQQVTSGSMVSLSFGYAGTPGAVSWYQGVKPDKSQRVGTGQNITVGPVTQTTSYWAEVSNTCGAAQTRTMLVTVTAVCIAPTITSVGASPSAVSAGGTVNLAVVANGSSLQYQWYRGQPLDVSNPLPNGNAANATDTPSATTTYWVRVSNSCGLANSDSVTVTVGSGGQPPPSCLPVVINAITENLTISSNTPVSLAVAASGGTSFHYAWFAGTSGDPSHPVGGDQPSFTSDPLFGNSSFWVKVTNDCGNSINSNTVTITVVPAKHRASRH